MIEVKRVNNTGRNKVDWIDDDVYYVPIVDGQKTIYVAETADMALIVGLAVKYDGKDSAFPKFAAKMLGIKSEWAK